MSSGPETSSIIHTDRQTFMQIYRQTHIKHLYGLGRKEEEGREGGRKEGGKEGRNVGRKEGRTERRKEGEGGREER